MERKTAGKVEAAVVEPEERYATSHAIDTTYGNCSYCDATAALQNGSSEWQLPTEFDTTLQRLISAWPEIPRAIREEIAAKAAPTHKGIATA